MKPQFTPGPYGIAEDHGDIEYIGGSVQIYQESDAQGCIEVGLVYTADAFGEYENPDEYKAHQAECRANARLFKHAPEMFYALECFAEIDENDAWKIGMKTEVDELRKLLERIVTDEESE